MVKPFNFEKEEDFNPEVMGRSLCMNFDAVVSSFARRPEERVLGALSSYIYDMPQYPGDRVEGGVYYSRYVKLPTSLIPQKQPSLLKEFASTVREYVGVGSSFFDLGPGPEWSVMKNTIPPLRILEPSEYFAVDIELEFTTEACKVVSREFPDISAQGAAVDFHSQCLPRHKSDTSIIWYPGSTLGNLPAKPGERFIENQFVLKHLKQLKKIDSSSQSSQDEQRYLVLLMDSRKDGVNSMVNLYRSAEAKGCFMSILHKLKRDLKAHDFNPGAFSYSPRWNDYSSVVEHQFTALETQEFSITDCFTGREETIKVLNGESYTLANSMKPSYEEMKFLLSRSGWETLISKWDTERQLYILLAQASGLEKNSK